jgi:hypothetical protein
LTWNLERLEGSEHQEVRKMQQTSIDTIDRETHIVDIQNTSIGGIRWKVALSTLFGRVKRDGKAIYSSIVASPPYMMVAEDNDECWAMVSGVVKGPTP